MSADSPPRKPPRDSLVSYHSSESSSSGSPTRKLQRHSRAYQARIAKARSIQQALNRPAIYSKRQQDSTSTQARSPIQYEMTTDDRPDFETNQGMVWAELDAAGVVTALALSRSQPTFLASSEQPLLLAVGTDNGTVNITELLDDSIPSFLIEESSKSKRVGHTQLIERTDCIRALDFSPTAPFLVIAGDDCVAAIYDTSSFHLVHEIQRVDRVTTAQFHPHGKYLAVGGYDGSVAIVSTLSWQLVYEIPRDGLVYALAWSPDGQLLAIADSDKYCIIVETASWHTTAEIRRPNLIQCLSWNHNGRVLAVASTDVAIVTREGWTVQNQIDVRSLSSASSSPLRRPQKVPTMAWSPNGRYLVVAAGGSENKYFCTLLETLSYTVVQEFPRRFPVSKMVWGEECTLSGAPRRFLALGGEDGKVVLLKAGLEADSGTSSVSDDISSAASSYMSTRGDVVWKANTFKDMGALSSPGHQQQYRGASVKTVCFSRGSRSRPSAFFATATDDCAVTIRSPLDWKVIRKLKFNIPISVMIFSHGSRYLILGDDEGNLHILITAPKWSVLSSFLLGGSISCLAFSKNNERLAVGSTDGVVTLIEPQENWKLSEVITRESAITALDWTSKYLAFGCHDGSISLYETEKILNNIFSPSVELRRQSQIRALSTGGGSRFLAIASGDGMLGIHSEKSGWKLCHRIQTDRSVSCITWCPMGRYLAYSEESTRFHIVDTVFWAEVEDAKGLQRTSESVNGRSNKLGVSFSQDGKLIATSAASAGSCIISTSSWRPVFDLCNDMTDIDESSLSSPEETDDFAQSE